MFRSVAAVARCAGISDLLRCTTLGFTQNGAKKKNMSFETYNDFCGC